MADNLIRWKRGDYVKLSKAINKFNKQINTLQKEGYINLPETRDYQSIKKDIYTRKELNRLVNSMKKFSVDSAKTIELQSGVQMTEWEYKELISLRRRAKNNLQAKLEIMERENPYAKYGIDTKEIEIARSNINSLNKFESKSKGFELNRIIDRIKRLGSYDAEMAKAMTYKRNYMEALEQMSNYDNYDLLKAKLESIKNPEQFYDFVKNSPTLSDLFEYYHDDPEAQTIAGYTNNQEAFNRGLMELGLLSEDYNPLSYDLTDLSDIISSIE